MVSIQDAEHSLPKGVLIKNILISYPEHWFSPVKLSPFFCTIEKDTINWMGSLGLIETIDCMSHLRAMEPRFYAGYSHPMASYESALTYCKYITMWLLWDDECVEVATSYEEVAAPLLALAGHDVSPIDQADPYVRAFKHIGDEYERLGASREWRTRFAGSMTEWAKSAIEEQVVRLTDRSKLKDRKFVDALKLRAITVVIRPNSIPLERAVGIEIPEYIYKSDDYRRLIDCAAQICCIMNDLVGVAKDIKNGQSFSNLVLYYQIIFKESLESSFSAVVDIHNEAIKSFDELAMRLVESVDSLFKERLSEFISQLRYMDSGFGFWHERCIRYQKTIVFEGDSAFKVRLVDPVESPRSYFKKSGRT